LLLRYVSTRKRRLILDMKKLSRMRSMRCLWTWPTSFLFPSQTQVCGET